MELVRDFVDKHSEVSKLIADDDVKGAKDAFLDLVAAYNKLAASDLDHHHKEIAHNELSKIHEELSKEERAVRIPINLIVAGVLLIVFSFVVFMNPSIVGLITFEDEVVQPLNLSFAESRISSHTLKDVPLSLAVSGTFFGDVKLYYKRGNDLVLVFDSATQEGESFSRVCEDTCDLRADSNVVDLFAQVGEDSYLQLDELVYTVPRDDNQAPVWTGEGKIFTVKKSLTLDLSEYFSDPDGDDLVFLSTSSDGLTVTVEDSIVHISSRPGASGEKKLTFIASDMEKLTKVHVKIVVA